MSKELTAADGFPAGAIEGLEGEFVHQKRVDHFDRRMIELQKDYARKLLTHVNPYTGRSYLDEPGVAIVEVNNENTLLTLWPGAAYGTGLDDLPDYFKSQLVTRWNDWLKAKYGDDDAMLAAWNAGVEPVGASIFSADQAWTGDEQQGADATVTPEGEGADGAAPPVTLEVVKTGTADWHAQAHVAGLTLDAGRAYTLAFDARSDGPRSARVAATLDESPWANVGLNRSFETDGEWRTFTMPFTASGTRPGHNRIAFAFAADPATLHLRGVTVRPGAAPASLPDGQSLASGTVGLPKSPTAAQRRDYADFLVSVETAYGEEMLAFLRDDLGVKGVLTVSQVQWGGLAGYERERAADLVDAHAYAGHPSFPPGDSWNPARWTIENASEVRRLAETGACELTGLARVRQAGKSFGVSEYDHPAPSDYAAEMMPMLAGVAAAQDWDAVYTFALGPYGSMSGGGDAKITGFFDQLGHPAKAAFYPFAAHVVRGGAVPAIGPAATLKMPADGYHDAPYADAAWRAASADVDALSSRLAVEPGAAVESFAVERSGDGGASPLSLAGDAPVLAIAADRAAGLVGFLAGETLSAGPLTVVVPAAPADAPDRDRFAAVTVHSLDDTPVRSAARSLVTAVGRAENAGMDWNESRTSVGDRWGSGPAGVRGLAMTVAVERDRPATVYTLDVHGSRKSEVPATFADGRLTFGVTPEQATVWYEVAE